MPRLRITATFGTTAQAFDLDAAVISVGRLPDSVLVLPLPWVGETHLLISDDPSGGVRVKTLSELRVASLSGLPIPLGGTVLTGQRPFEITLFSPTGDALLLRCDPVATPLPRPGHPAPLAGRRGNPIRYDLLGGAAVLAAAILLAAYLAVSSHTPPPAAVPQVDPKQAQSAKELDAAASSYLIGDAAGARRHLDATTAGGLYPEVVAEALRRDARAATVPASKPAPAHAIPQVLETPPLPVPLAPPSQPAGPTPAVPAPAGLPVPSGEIAAARADIAAGKELKATPLGTAALAHARGQLKSRLTGSQLTYPDDADDRVVVLLNDDDTLTIRAYADQFNAAHVPLRLFYLSKLKPLDKNAWQDLAFEVLK